MERKDTTGRGDVRGDKIKDTGEGEGEGALEEDTSIRVTQSGRVSHRTASAFSLRQKSRLSIENRRTRGRTGISRMGTSIWERYCGDGIGGSVRMR